MDSTKAERAAALRAEKRAALEAAALRANLLRRKQQARAQHEIEETAAATQSPESEIPCP